MSLVILDDDLLWGGWRRRERQNAALGLSVMRGELIAGVSVW